MKRYAIIGCGALGGLYGARLHQAGAEVHFLFHSDFDHVRRHGLRVDSIWGDLHLRDIHAYQSVRDMPPCDVVCVCLKTTSNKLLPELLPPITGPGAAVLLMQNGLGAEPEVAQFLPGAKVAGGLCFLCSHKVGPGHIRHMDYGRIEFALFSAGGKDMLQEIVADFRAAGVPSETAGDLVTARWKKLCWNIPYNGLCVVLNAETDRLMADAHTRELIRQLMAEVVVGARAAGGEIPHDFPAKLMAYTETMKPYSPSMKLDFEAGRPMEIEYIYDRPLAVAQAAGVTLPRMGVLADQLHFLDRRREGLP